MSLTHAAPESTSAHAEMLCPNCRAHVLLPPASAEVLEGMRTGATAVHPHAELIVDFGRTRSWAGTCACGANLTVAALHTRPMGRG